MGEVNPTVWENKDKRSMRAMCLSYAKDLVCAGRLSKATMIEQAQQMFVWVWGEQGGGKDAN